MVRIYISCPTYGRSIESVVSSIDTLKRYAELMLGDECVAVNEDRLLKSCIDSVTEHIVISDVLSRLDSIKDVDVFVGISSDAFISCSCERDFAHRFNKRVLLIDYDECAAFSDVNKNRYIDY